LVLSTLHTNDAVGAISRLLDMKIERFLLSSTLKTVVAQRLARRLCEYCKKETKLTAEAAQEIVAELSNAPFNIVQGELPELSSPAAAPTFYKVYKNVGCPHCENTGYSNRVALAEAVEINDQLREIIDNGEKNINAETVKSVEDFLSIKQDGIIKVLQGKTTLEEVIRVIES